MDRFRSALEDCELSDLGFAGDLFTWWNNNHNSNEYVRERFDRAVANEEWRAHFPLYKVINGEPRHSDHRPVVVLTEEDVHSGARRGGQSFRFEAHWVEEEQCAPIVENAWKTVMEGRRGTVMEAVQSVATDLGDWNRNVLGDLEKRMK
ncbi:uncharacterized protein LOC105915158 [Setaria italica]|uniref:uncharacterized protein LOC105915158 n=1 Tax=Setaria italica TaxID=4555 RepID=UPI000BE59ED1|nr:uncharacterized protein LOC105915158 [Setaria italica]